MTNADFATWLRVKMAERNVSGKGLAQLLNVSHVAVGRWVNGKNRPTYENCVKIADFFHVPEYELLFITGHRQSLPIHQPTHVAEAPIPYHTDPRKRTDELLAKLTPEQLEALNKFLETLQ